MLEFSSSDCIQELMEVRATSICGGCVCYGSGVAEVHTHTAAEASMCENKLFF